MKQEFLDKPRSYKPSELLELAGIAEPPVDLNKLVDALGISVSRNFDFEKAGLSGKISWSDDRSTADVWVNPLDSSRRQRFTLSHELGHLFQHMLPEHSDMEAAEEFSDKPRYFHRDGSISSNEREANRFAAQLLMPRAFVKQWAQKIAKEYRQPNGKISLSKDEFIDKLADTFQVSKQAMEYRLKNLGII